MKTLQKLLLVFLLLCLLPVSALGEYRTLTIGDKGEDVVALKRRLYELGFYTSASFSDAYTQNTGEKIGQFLSRYGLLGTDATPETQALLFALDARDVSYQPSPLPSAVLSPVGSPALPTRAEDGTLLDKAAPPFLYKDDADGLWYYISGTLSIEIRRYEDKTNCLKWFETRVQVSGGNRMRAVFSDDKASGKVFDLPLKIAKKHNAILAFSDDFFGWRKDFKKTEGIVIRNGRVYSDKTYEKNLMKFPPLDILAVFPDGTLKTFAFNAHTAQEYLDMGVIDTYAFGPILVQDGVLNEHLDFEGADGEQPRSAVGVFAPNDYVFVTVMGRRTDSKGCTLRWLAEKMFSLGVTESLNLDGGNSTMLVFDGEMLNKSKTIATKEIRQMVSMIAFIDQESQ